MSRDIILLGDGWGAKAAYKGLLYFFPEIKVITTDDEVCPKSALTNIGISSCHNKVLIFAGYKPIVPSKVLQENLCINIHYSLLPKYRGLHSTVWAILNDESELGLTVHLMSNFVDDGPIIYQYAVKNDFVTTSAEYMELFNLHIEKELGKIIHRYLLGEIKPVPQDKTQATWVGRRKKEDCLIDFNQSIQYQKAFFRALVKPYPCPFVRYKGLDLNVTKVNYHEVNVNTHIGRILNIDDEGLWVKCKDGYLIIQELKDSEGRIVPFEQFKIGTYFHYNV